MSDENLHPDWQRVVHSSAWTIASHEAGRAVVALRLGCSVERIDTHTHEDKQWGITRGIGFPRNAHIERVTVSLAGYVTQWLSENGHDELVADELLAALDEMMTAEELLPDLDDALDELSTLCEFHGSEPDSPERRAAWQWAVLRTLRVVLHCWPEIKVTTDVFLAQGSVDSIRLLQLAFTET